MTTVLLGPQRFLTTAGTVAPLGRARGPGRDGHRRLAGPRGRRRASSTRSWTGAAATSVSTSRLTDVLDTDDRFAGRGAGPPRRDGRAGRHLLAPAPARARERVRRRPPARRATTSPTPRSPTRCAAVRDIDDWYLGPSTSCTASSRAPLRPRAASRSQRHRARGRRGCSRDAARRGDRRRPRRHPAALPAAVRRRARRRELPVVAWSAGAMALTERVVLYNDRGPQGVAGRGGLGPRARTGPGRGRDAARPPPPAARRPDARAGARAAVRAAPLPAARRRRPASRSAPTGRVPGRMLACSTTTARRQPPGAVMSAVTPRPSWPSTGCSTGKPLDGAAIDRFIERHGAPIIEGARATFLWRGRRRRGVGPAPGGRAARPAARCGRDQRHRPLVRHHRASPRARGSSTSSRSPAASTPSRSSTTRSTPSSRTGRSARARCARRPATRCRTGASTIPRRGPGELVERSIASKALRRQVPVPALPAGAVPHRGALPAAVVHDGARLPQLHLGQDRARQPDPPQRGRGDGGRVRPARGDRLVEYANHAPHARFVARELVPYLTDELPARRQPRRADA